MTNNLNPIGQLAEHYGNFPIIRSLLQLIPGWSSVDILVQHRAGQIRIDRMRTFFDELADGKRKLTEELIRSEDFLHAFFSTLQAAINTRHREKIRLFARLLNSSLPTDINATDEYEELLSALDTITMREFAVLCYLRNLERQHPQVSEASEVQKAWEYWGQFKNQCAKQYGISAESFTGFMARLERTGLYLRITGAYYDYDGDMGRTTPLLERLVQLVQQMS